MGTEFLGEKAQHIRSASVQIRLIAAGLCAATGIIVQFGWVFDVNFLKHILPGLTAMNPVTACVLLVAATAMFLHQRANWKTIYAFGTFILLVGLIKLLHFAGILDFPIDQLLFTSKLDDALNVPPNQMAPNTAAALIVSGLSIVTSKSQSPGIVIFSQVLACLIIAITLFAIIGYSLGIIAFYGIRSFTPMAIHTAFALLMIAVAVLSTSPHLGLTRLIGDRGPAGQLSRVLLPLVVLVPVILGMLRLKGQELGYYDTPTGVALQVLGNVIVTFCVLMIGIVLLYRADIARRARELTVRRSDEQFRLAEKLGQVGNWHLDLETGVLECSSGLVQICGLEGQRLTRNTVLSLYHPEDAILERLSARRALVEGEGWTENRRLILPDGGHRTIRSHGNVERNQEGNIVSLFGVFVEVTELERSRRQAEAATAAQADFLANMSHEIRTPLNAIIGFTDLILEDVGLSDIHRRQLRLVKNSGDALLTVVNDILDFSKMEAGKVRLVTRPFNLAHLAQGTVSIIRQSAETKGLAITVVTSKDLSAYFVGDDSRIRQILLNLLSNAVKFTERGSVSLTITGQADCDGHHRVTFVVADTGIGVSADQEQRLFRQFSQANSSISREYGGTGLGLAISKTLVGLMDGRIGFRPRANGGSEFWFDIVLEPTVQNETDTSAPHRFPTNAQRILVVEDVVANQELVAAMLSRGGHQVHVVANGREAISVVQVQEFDLILMDVQMPVMDGITASKLIRMLPGKVRNIPIIALTANILPEQIETFHRAGMNDHVGKPINFRELTDAIARNTGQYSELAAQPSIKSVSDNAGFDEGAYCSLAAMLPRDRFEMHFASLRSAMEELGKFEGPTDQLASAAHKMISQAGMFGFVGLSDLCRKLETAVESEKPVEDLLAEIRSAVADALAKIDDLQHPRRRWVA